MLGFPIADPAYYFLHYIHVGNQKAALTLLMHYPELIYLPQKHKDLGAYQKLWKMLNNKVDPAGKLSEKEKRMFTAAEYGDWATVMAYDVNVFLRDGYGLTLWDYAYFDSNEKMMRLFSPRVPCLEAYFENLRLVEAPPPSLMFSLRPPVEIPVAKPSVPSPSSPSIVKPLARRAWGKGPR